MLLANFYIRKKCILLAVSLLSFFTATVTANALFLKEGQRIIFGRGDTKFEVCNFTGKKLWVAYLYENVTVRPSTFVPKGWFEYEHGSCTLIAINGLFGVMSVQRKNKDGELVPYYADGDISLAETQVGYSQVQRFVSEDFCIGEAPFSGYRDNAREWLECKENEKTVPFNIIFKQGGNKNYTLNLR